MKDSEKDCSFTIRNSLKDATSHDTHGVIE